MNSKTDAVKIPPAPAAPIIMETSECSTCHKVKSKDEYSKEQWRRRKNKKTNPNGGVGHCKDCIHDAYVLRKYGLTPTDVQAMFAAQKHVCFLSCCRKPIDKTNVHIDHDHHTKKVRGLLCMECNTSLGKFKDRVDYLLDVACYLASSTTSLSPRMALRTDKAMSTLNEWHKKIKGNKSL